MGAGERGGGRVRVRAGFDAGWGFSETGVRGWGVSGGGHAWSVWPVWCGCG